LRLLFTGTLADIYMHVPRGSNNRLNEETNPRANEKRLFDSENNNNGGYNVADRLSTPAKTEEDQHKAIYFQSGKAGFSELSVEWWSQHGCGKKDENDANWIDCQVILQYMCQDADSSTIRNGMDTSTPRFKETKKPSSESYSQKQARKAEDETKSPSAGRHESWEYYDACFNRERNFGLFTADQARPTNRGATRTRQNPGGTQYGYECPEEKDFFPYWHPTPWTDIAVLTSQMNNCNMYKEESFNRKPKHRCLEVYTNQERGEERKFKHFSSANNEYDCAQVKGTWTSFYNFQEIFEKANSESECQDEADRIGKTFGTDMIWGVPYLDGEGRHELPKEQCLILPAEIECDKAPWGRANHLGNTKNDDLASYKWKIPHFEYLKENEAKECVLRVRYNISSNDYKEDFDQKTTTPYYPYEYLTDFPKVQLLPRLDLTLAIDVRQIARTFQDRSHVFEIRARPEAVKDEDNLYNIGVRGRRGNIVQTFPSLEYDFSPNSVSGSSNDLFHIQWEGSNSQPPNQAGQGKDQTDRNNMVSMEASNYNIPHGKVEGDEVKTFKVEYSTGETTYEYRIIEHVNPSDAQRMCENFGMSLPEPRDEIFNNALKELWKNERRSHFIILGLSDAKVEGEFRYYSDDAKLEEDDFQNWRRNNFVSKPEKDYVGLIHTGKWQDYAAKDRSPKSLCLKVYEEKDEKSYTGIFESAEWKWSSLNTDSTNGMLDDNQNLLVQMASSGYFHCTKTSTCERSLEHDHLELDGTLDIAPASFHGNIIQLPVGQYWYMCTRNNNFSNRAQKGAITIV